MGAHRVQTTMRAIQEHDCRPRAAFCLDNLAKTLRDL